ncbi:MAG TPA: fused MFS/spermidine synthase [Polyangia bacterium]
MIVRDNPVIRALLLVALATGGCHRGHHDEPGAAHAPLGGQVLFEGDSAYNHMMVLDRDHVRCLMFGAFRAKKSRATCIDTVDRDRHVFDYTAKMFIGFMLRPQTTSVATLGLGGGMVAGTFARHLPDVALDAVEIDPLVVKLARQYFGFAESKNVHLFVDDGRQFLHKTKSRYDQIWLDAFNSDYIPAHMTTKEFLTEARSKLKPGGLLVSNVHSPNQLFPAQVATHRQVFRSVRVFRCNNNYNAIIVASDAELPATIAELRTLAAGPLRAIPGVDVAGFAPSLVDVNTGNAPTLTDDYSPANLLLQKQAPAL